MWNNIKTNPKDPRYIHTLKEILQQPSCWKKTAEIIFSDSKLQDFLKTALGDPARPILVSGAGSSEFVGQSIMQSLALHTNRRVINAPTTDIVTTPSLYAVPQEPALMISFARSGNSPESVAAVNLIKQTCPGTKHLIITCNKEGGLAKNPDANTYVILLPEETNDRSLVMTSSFSSMALAAALLMVPKEKGMERLQDACLAAEEILAGLPQNINNFIAPAHINRIQYLGTGNAKGVLTEGHLKMLEMTDGAVATRVDSFLGVRHGPQVFTDKNTVVIALLSENDYVRQYEIDLLNEMKAKKQGCGFLVIGRGAKNIALPNLLAVETKASCDCFRIFPALIVVQLLGFFKSLSLGLSPDAPSASGTINRVVQGVNIYPYKG